MCHKNQNARAVVHATSKRIARLIFSVVCYSLQYKCPHKTGSGMVHMYRPPVLDTSQVQRC